MNRPTRADLLGQLRRMNEALARLIEMLRAGWDAETLRAGWDAERVSGVIDGEFAVKCHCLMVAMMDLVEDLSGKPVMVQIGSAEPEPFPGTN
jgi:hypothetical protein